MISHLNMKQFHILAPSDRYIISADENGNTRMFSGTSGATPLVTGSLAGFEWMSGYHPTADEVKVLLEKTAIPTLSANQRPRLNGVGMINAYKLGMVGKKLQESCGTDADCFQTKINEEETYTFEIDKESLLSQVDEAFPQCSQTMCKGESNLACPNKEEAFNDLREAAFLIPEDKDLWRAVGCVYEVNNLSENAAGVMSIYRFFIRNNQRGFRR